jgi:hypothetical protein
MFDQMVRSKTIGSGYNAAGEAREGPAIIAGWPCSTGGIVAAWNVR